MKSPCLVEVPNDNQCLFHCINLSIFDGKNTVLGVKQMCINEIEKDFRDKKFYLPFFENKEAEIKKYIKDILHPDFWGSYVEICVFSKLFQIEFVVLESNKKKVLQRVANPEGSKYKKRIYLYYCHLIDPLKKENDQKAEEFKEKKLVHYNFFAWHTLDVQKTHPSMGGVWETGDPELELTQVLSFLETLGPNKKKVIPEKETQNSNSNSNSNLILNFDTKEKEKTQEILPKEQNKKEEQQKNNLVIAKEIQNPLFAFQTGEKLSQPQRPQEVFERAPSSIPLLPPLPPTAAHPTAILSQVVLPQSVSSAKGKNVNVKTPIDPRPTVRKKGQPLNTGPLFFQTIWPPEKSQSLRAGTKTIKPGENRTQIAHVVRSSPQTRVAASLPRIVPKKIS